MSVATRSRTITGGLSGLDKLAAEILVLPMFQDEQPLRGLAGYCDWRLNGRLSRLIESTFFRARLGEVLLTNTQRRIGTERLLLVGLGRRAEHDENRFRQAVQTMLTVLGRARFQRFAVELPIVRLAIMSDQNAQNLFLSEAIRKTPEAEIVFIGSETPARGPQPAREKSQRLV